MDRNKLQKVIESDLYRLYPTDLLVTGFDIIFFWVARMVLMGMYNMEAEPFKTVYIHGLVRDKEGNKMSKTKGNVVDPLDMIAKYGTDALRFSLAIQTTPGSDIKFDESRVEGYKHFANKIWNASRYILMNLPENFQVKDPLKTDLKTEDKWILATLNETVKTVREGLDTFNYSKSAQALYDFFWDQFCDWYIEFTKERIYKGSQQDKETALNTLVYVLDKALKLLHPFMPYITEEIWDYLPTKDKKSISLAEFPKYQENLKAFETVRQQIEHVKEIITAIRNFRNMLEIPPKVRLKAFYQGDSLTNALIEEFKGKILSLAKLETLEPTQERPQNSLAIPIKGGKIFISIEGVINIAETLAAQRKKKEKLLKELKRVEAKLNNPKFLERAPKAVVEKERRIYEELKLQLERINSIISLLEG
ncbi:MAG: class I tRNA ligase family protein [Aquificae bacterium]|nr:class I tRNA ligase family protein [Aquificota bacterium]